MTGEPLSTDQSAGSAAADRSTDRLRSAAAPGILAVAMGIMNVATYGFQILASRALGPAPFGAFAAVMNLLLLVGVGQLALQATAARRISAAPDDVRAIEGSVLRLTYRFSLFLGLALLLLTPAIDALLRLDDLMLAAMVGVVAVPQTVMGGHAGVLQGERRWRPLALLYAAAGVPRVVIGGAMIAVRPDELTAVIAVAIGALAPVAVGVMVLRRGRTAVPSAEGPSSRELLREIGRKAHALAAFVALCNVDLIIARNVLTEHDAGHYAAGLILTKAVLFLPQFVVVVAFPSLATVDERRRALVRGLGLITVCGVSTAAGVAVLPSLALTFVGGQEYAGIRDDLWLFAILGLLLALIQMLVYAVLATEGRRTDWLPWLSVVAIAVGGSLAGSILALVVTVVATNAILTAALLLVAARSVSERAARSAGIE